MALKRKQKISPILILGVLFVALFAFSANSFADENAAKEAFNKGIEYKQAGDKVGALASFKLCIKEDPNYANAYNQMGSMYFADKKYDEALSNFKLATEKDAKNVEAFSNLGKVQYKLKKYAEAEQSFKSSIALKEDADTYKELGKVYYKKKNYKDVITAFMKSHELGGGDHVTHYMLGKAYQKSSKMADAIKALKKSAKIKSDYYLAHSTLGQIYLSQEKYKSAASAYKRAMNSKSKRKYKAAYNYAIAVETSDPENYSANIANWKKFVKMAKGNPNAKTDVSVAEGHITDLEDALEKAKLQ